VVSGPGRWMFKGNGKEKKRCWANVLVNGGRAKMTFWEWVWTEPVWSSVEKEKKKRQKND